VKLTRTVWAFCVFLLFPVSAYSTLEEQRASFIVAHNALLSGQNKAFNEQFKTLENYPLYHYLQFDDMVSRSPRLSLQEVEDFLHDTEDSPLAERFRKRWIRFLAKQQRWSDFLNFYQPTSQVDLQCQYWHARLTLKVEVDDSQSLLNLWEVGHSQPKVCDRPFESLYQSGKITPELLWSRLSKAMRVGNVSLAKFLAAKLPVKQQRRFYLWHRVYRHPARFLDDRRLQKKAEWTTDVIVQGIRRLARSDVSEASHFWNKFKKSQTFSQSVVQRLDRHLALLSATRWEDNATSALSALTVKDDAVHGWRVRQALRRQDWHAVQQQIEKMPDSLQQQNVWRYWRARALEQLGEKTQAVDLYKSLSGERDFHGFLAAERIGEPYALQSQVATVNDGDFNGLLQSPAFVRARELYLLGREREARSEWSLAMRGLTKRQRIVSAIFAHRLGWHDRAINTAAKARYTGDLALRFPKAFVNRIKEEADKWSLDREWILAIGRRESTFRSDARSQVGALGVMQIMPYTGRHIARRLREKWHTGLLLDAQHNIRLGVAYLQELSDLFSEHTVLATAAYNAGPRNVQRWLPKTEMPSDVWIETMPFKETRRYVRAILAYLMIYRHLDNKPTQLATYMKIVPASPSLLAKYQKKKLASGG
jgi:soluble lytic murein transglycosylase